MLFKKKLINNKANAISHFNEKNNLRFDFVFKKEFKIKSDIFHKKKNQISTVFSKQDLKNSIILYLVIFTKKSCIKEKLCT